MLTAHVPGVNPEDVEITFGRGTGLFVAPSRRCRKRSTPSSASSYHGSFERKLNFNVPVNADAIEATYSNGVLSLRVPKAEEIKPKRSGAGQVVSTRTGGEAAVEKHGRFAAR